MQQPPNRPFTASGRILAAGALLALPYAVLAGCLASAKGVQSLAAYLASVGLLLWLCAVLTGTWRRFFLLHSPLWLLAAVFAAYAYSYGSPPGELLAYVLATSSWDEVVGFFGIWQGERLLIGTAVLTARPISGWPLFSPATLIFPGPKAYWRLGLLRRDRPCERPRAPEPTRICARGRRKPCDRNSNVRVGDRCISRSRRCREEPFPRWRTALERVPEEEVHMPDGRGKCPPRFLVRVWLLAGKTTPNIDGLRSEMILFKNAVADANVTVCAVPRVLTGMSPARFDLKAVRGNLGDILPAKQAIPLSYALIRTRIFRSSLGLHPQRMVYPPSLRTLAASRLSPRSDPAPGGQRLIAQQGGVLIGLHVIGSHWAYDSRYPRAFALFGSGRALSEPGRNVRRAPSADRRCL